MFFVALKTVLHRQHYEDSRKQSSNISISDSNTRPVSAEQAGQAMAIVEMFLKDQPKDYCTAHELNVFHSLHNVILHSARVSRRE